METTDPFFFFRKKKALQYCLKNFHDCKTEMKTLFDSNTAQALRCAALEGTTSPIIKCCSGGTEMSHPQLWSNLFGHTQTANIWSVPFVFCSIVSRQPVSIPIRNKSVINGLLPESKSMLSWHVWSNLMLETTCFWEELCLENFSSDETIPDEGYRSCNKQLFHKAHFFYYPYTSKLTSLTILFEKLCKLL